jgi:outer membrane immunogenic protein
VLLLFAVPAQAQDSKDGDFGGFYAGLDAGATEGRAHYSLPGDTSDQLLNPRGDATSLSGGVLVGFNHQAGDWVVGVEADVTGLQDVLKATACTVPDGCFVTTHDSFTTFNNLKQGLGERVRLRVGKVMGGSLFYLAGGWSGEHTQLNLVGDCYNAANPTVPLVFKFSRSKDVSGFNVGAGIEHPVGAHLMVRGEAIVDDYGNQGYAGAAPEWNSRSIGLSNITLRAAVSYRF